MVINKLALFGRKIDRTSSGPKLQWTNNLLLE